MFCVRQAIFLALFLLALSCRAAPPYGAGTAAPGPNKERSEPGSGRKLRGKFLQITDVHPDPFYKTYSATDEEAACHRGRGPAGVYGAETSDCDTPLSLVDQTFKWIAENIKDEIDFVVWTGDSARHDNDEKIPRSQAQILEQNELLVQKFTEVFGKDDNINDTDPTNDFILPIVPTFGNNDIMPHNIFLSGPNKWTLKYLSIWKSFIPEAQRHQFAQGGWFSVEVIPNKLAVISLNTLYFFASNSGVDGCAAKSEPGYEHMEWLRIQLQLLRERGMKAILMGHVPPARVSSKSSWEETCWQKYTLWTRQYRDVITASLYGHMNIDHFMLQDFKDLKKSTKKGAMKSMGARATMLEDGELTTASASSYLRDLRDEWAKLPTPPNSFALSKDADIEEEPFSPTKWLSKFWTQKKQGKKAKKSKGGKGKKDTFLDKIGGRYGERFSVTLVSPSVVPNYFPTLRIYEYNITGLDEPNLPLEEPLISSDKFGQHPLEVDDLEIESEEETEDQEKINRKGEKTTKKKKKYKFKVPKPPSKSSPPGPAYSPQTFTLLGYTQYFANLTHINNDFVDALSHMDEDESMLNATRWKHGKHHGKERKHNKPHPKKFKFQVEYDTHKDKIFKLKDLTVRSYIDLARRIGASQSKHNMIGNHDQDVEDCTDVSGGELEEAKKGDKKKDGKEKKKKKKHGKKNTWYTFVKRAFVGTLDPESIEEQFGTVEGSIAGVEEMVEL